MRRKRKSWLKIERSGMWYKNGKWYKEAIPGSSSCKIVRTLEQLNREFNRTPPPCNIDAFYYHSWKRGKGWVSKWYNEK